MTGIKSRDHAGIGSDGSYKAGQGLWITSEGKRESWKGFYEKLYFHICILEKFSWQQSEDRLEESPNRGRKTN